MPCDKAGRPRSGVASGLIVLVLACVCSWSSLARGQGPASTGATVRVDGSTARPLVLREADLEALPRHRLTVTDEKGALITYEGVAVAELLSRAAVPLGKQLRGKDMKLYVMARASDGYEVLFALAEFDPDFTDRVIILADRRDGRAIRPPEGPFRLIVPGEKRHARWVREVMELDVEAAK